MNKKKRKFIKSLNDDIQSEVFDYFLIQEKLKKYREDVNEFSFDHFNFEIRKLKQRKQYQIELQTLRICVDKYDFDLVLKKGIQDFILEHNMSEEMLAELEMENEELFFSEHELFKFLLIYDFKITRKQIERLFSLLFKEKKIKFIG